MDLIGFKIVLLTIKPASDTRHRLLIKYSVTMIQLLPCVNVGIYKKKKETVLRRRKVNFFY